MSEAGAESPQANDGLSDADLKREELDVKKRELALKEREYETKRDELAQKRQATIVDVWKQAIDTQKHFNDMCVKSRQLGLTFLAAALGAALYLFIRSPGGDSASNPATYAYALTIGGHSVVVHVSLVIIGAAAASVYAVRKLDLGVYHQMLRGAVSFNEDLEQVHLLKFVELNKGMTQAVSHFSRHSDARVQDDRGRYVYEGSDRKNAGEKLNTFYNVIFFSLFVMALAIFVASNFMKAV